ncbi:MAG: PH domain-containing protein [Planctomycetota bacterium]|jgi:membrane protein YdbS with pleckstrin-like domain
MSTSDQVPQRVYKGIWLILATWFRVPPTPPDLPVRPGESVESFRPSPDFLRYLKFWFWLVLTVVDLLILIGWIALTVAEPWAGALLAPVALALVVIPDVVVYVALHLRYDATWYVMTPRSIRIRRGIWVIQEVTITFENVQNVNVSQGPLQRHFNISNVVIETAGSGGKTNEPDWAVMNQGLIEGIADPDRVRSLIMERARASTTAGLGDEGEGGAAHATGFSAEHVSILREIRDEIGTLQA